MHLMKEFTILSYRKFQNFFILDLGVTNCRLGVAKGGRGGRDAGVTAFLPS